MAYTGLLASPGRLNVPSLALRTSGLNRASVEPPRPETNPAPRKSPPPDRSINAPDCTSTYCERRLTPALSPLMPFNMIGAPL
ncbi:hypothetical protein D3C72_543370 [compost metagenome]